KTLIYHLTEAAIAGRDIYYDQRYAHGLEMREVIEGILTHAGGVKSETLSEIQRYAKLFWLNSSPYHNLTTQKFVLKCTPEAFAEAAKSAASAGAAFPLAGGETVDAMLTRMKPLFFDEAFQPSVTVKTPPAGGDILTASANNLYVGVSTKDLTGFKEQFPLNSRLVKQDGKLGEEEDKMGGRVDGQSRAI